MSLWLKIIFPTIPPVQWSKVSSTTQIRDCINQSDYCENKAIRNAGTIGKSEPGQVFSVVKIKAITEA